MDPGFISFDLDSFDFAFGSAANFASFTIAKTTRAASRIALLMGQPWVIVVGLLSKSIVTRE